jgi:FeS assembly SUF system protein
MSLPVLSHSGKVEQLREELARGIEASRNAPAPSTGYVPHVNRVKWVAQRSPHQLAIEEKVVQALRTVFDPEIPVNIYELGLIYDIDVDELSNVHVRMTLTAPGCPVAGSLPLEVERKIEDLPEVKSAAVELVWEPQWSREMMSEAAQLDLGF